MQGQYALPGLGHRRAMRADVWIWIIMEWATFREPAIDNKVPWLEEGNYLLKN
jgi:hypothetical protein